MLLPNKITEFLKIQYLKNELRYEVDISLKWKTTIEAADWFMHMKWAWSAIPRHAQVLENDQLAVNLRSTDERSHNIYYNFITYVNHLM